MKKGVEESGNVVTKDIPLSLIDKDPNNEKIFRMTDIEHLAEIIKENGFTGAIEVYQKPNGRYLIASGHRRFEAMKLLEEKTIPCYISPMDNPQKVKLKLIDSNLHTRMLSPLELARAIQFYEEILYETNFQGPVNAQIAKHFGLSVSKINKLKTLTKMTESIQEMAVAPNFPYEAFYDAASFNKANQEKLFTMLQEHIALFPDGELTLVVTQCINRIKADIEIEKERSKRENEKKEFKQRITDEEAAPVFEKVEEPEYFQNVKGIDELERAVVEKVEEKSSSDVKLEPQSISYNEAGTKLSELSSYETRREEKDVTYEIKTSIHRVNSLLNEENIVIKDKAAMDSMVEELKSILNKLNELKKKDK